MSFEPEEDFTMNTCSEPEQHCYQLGLLLKRLGVTPTDTAADYPSDDLKKLLNNLLIAERNYATLTRDPLFKLANEPHMEKVFAARQRKTECHQQLVQFTAAYWNDCRKLEYSLDEPAGLEAFLLGFTQGSCDGGGRLSHHNVEDVRDEPYYFGYRD